MDLCPGCDRPENDHDPQCIFLSFKKANRPSPLSDGLVGLVDLQDKYIKLLTGEIMEMAGYVSADGWVSTKIEEGKKLRAEIDNARDKAY